MYNSTVSYGFSQLIRKKYQKSVVFPYNFPVRLGVCNSAYDEDFFFFIFGVSVTGLFASFGQLYYNDTVFFCKAFFIIVFYFRFDVLENSVAVFYFKKGILKPESEF